MYVLCAQITKTGHNLECQIKHKLVFCCSYELVPFTKLGWKNEERAWLFMLGAVTGGTVDLGLDNVVITPERYSDMFFTLPIVQSMYVNTFLTKTFFLLFCESHLVV
jgi:ABC-type amino acid transport/signal transduction systems, periplasmic component/domain